MFPTSSFRGFFEVLMPGVFLLLHLFAFVGSMALAWPQSSTPAPGAVFRLAFLELAASPAPSIQANPSTAMPSPLNAILSNQAFGAAILLSAGYMLGVVLRMQRCEAVDALSFEYCRLLNPAEDRERYSTETFFYPNWLNEKLRTRLPDSLSVPTNDFFDKFWALRNKPDTSQPSEAKSTDVKPSIMEAVKFLLSALVGCEPSAKQTEGLFRFNFLKVLLLQCDERSANEVVHLEALCRFVAGSFRALRYATFLLVGAALLSLIGGAWRWSCVALLVVLIYFAAIHHILRNFRYLRLKESVSVFAACFANRSAFEQFAIGPDGTAGQSTAVAG